ncbi:hypothetical protein Tco_0987166 [Tanacetum coccineum]
MDQFIFQRRTLTNKEASTGPSAQPQDDASANIVRNSPSPVDAETGANTNITTSTANTEVLYVEDVQGEKILHTVVLKEKTVKLDEGQARSDPGKTPESRPPPKHEHMDEDHAGPNPGQSHEALAGPNPKPMDDDFNATIYPKVHESLKHTTEEHVHLENLLSSSGTLSSMKNLDDAFTFDDQFLNDSLQKRSQGKLLWKLKLNPWSLFLFIKPLHQFLLYPNPSLIFHHQNRTTNSLLASRVLTLEQRCVDLEKKHKLQDKTTQALSSRIFTLELKYLPHKINQTVNEAVKEAVHVDLQAPFRDRFRKLPETDMKEILHQRMFESGTYKSHPEHVALYEALEASMERANQDEFLAEKDKSQKRRCDDQDPPPPPPDSDLSKKKRHDTGTSGLKQPLAPQSFAWKTSDTREDPSSSSNQKSVPHSEQPIEDVPIPDDMNISDSEMEECHLLLIDQVDLVNPEGHRVVPDVSKPLSLGGPPGQVTIQTQYFFNKDLEYLVSGDKGRRSALSIYKLKAALYLDFGLEELVPSLWIESECDYDISDAYGISH